jgi:membrane dipeptidase
VSQLDPAARDLVRRFPLIDGHNDLPWELRKRGGLAAVNLAEPVDGTHTDLPRLKAGGVGAQFWSVFVPATLAGEAAVATVLEQIDLTRRMIAAYPQALELALTAADVERIFASGRVASLLGAEGGHAIAGSLGVLRMLHALGVRYLTLTHNANVGWADSATDEKAAGGLTDFGRDVVREMQRIGMLVDLSHVSPDTMHDALETAEAPVIFSHSSARAICDHPRNVPDDVLARLPGNGGVCMVTFVPAFVSQECADWLAGLRAEAVRRGLDPRDFAQLLRIKPEWEAAHPQPKATLSQVADHIEHVRRVAGVEHVGLGGDFDGTPDVTVGLEDVSTYPALFAELLARGWTKSDCAALARGNILRVLRQAESFAARARSLPQRGLCRAVGSAQDPAAGVPGPRGGGMDADRVAETDGARPDDPGVEGKLVAEPLPDAAEHRQVLGAGVRIDGGDDAALPHGFDPDDGVPDDQGVAGPVAFGVRGHVADEQVGPERAHVGAELGDGPVGGHEQVQDVEAFRPAIGRQPGMRPGGGAYRQGRLRGVPPVAGHPRDAVRAGDRRHGEQSVAGAAGERAVRAGDVHDPVPADPVAGELRGGEGLPGQ